MSEETKDPQNSPEDTDTIKIDSAMVESILNGEEKQESSNETDHDDALEPIAMNAENTQSSALTDKKQTKKKNNKQLSRKQIAIIIASAGIVIAIAIAVFFVVRNNSANQQDPSSVAYASYGNIQTYIEGSGYTAARNREEVGRNIKGTITDVLVEVGDTVEQGDILFEIDPTETNKELEAAQEELTALQSNLSQAKTALSTAQANLTTAKGGSSKLSVTAPFQGKLIPTDDGTTFSVGQYITAGTVIGLMVDDSSLKLPVYFSTAYKGSISAGQSATVSIPSNMSTVTGSVSSVDSAEKISSDGVATFRVVISLSNPGTLTKGMLATATVSTDSGEAYPTDSSTLQYNREEAVTATSSGEITAVNGLDYTEYSSGAVIMKISSDALSSDISVAQSAVTSAQSVVTAAQKQVTEKQKTITQLKKVISDANIEAPMSGVVVSLTGTIGQEMNGVDAVAVVADVEDIIVNASISATDVYAVEVGQTATVTMHTNDSTIEVYGSVISVAMESDKTQSVDQSGIPMFPAVIELYNLDEQSIRSDYPVEYKIITEESLDTLIVPSTAIVNTEEGPAVFAKPVEIEGQESYFVETLIIPEGTDVPGGYFLVPVELGISDASNTEILWGIDEGTEVYLAGPDDLAETDEVLDETIVYG